MKPGQACIAGTFGRTWIALATGGADRFGPVGLLGMLIGVAGVALALLVLALWITLRVERSRLGYYWRAIRDDQEGAEGIGIDSRLYKVIARCITAATSFIGTSRRFSS